MPRKNFENIGVLQGYEYIRGVITDDPDFDTDTCTVKIRVVSGEDQDGNATYDEVEFKDTPIFYHCSEDAEEREDNGAIEGSAAGFTKDDEVILLKQREGAPGPDGEPVASPKIFVIGHVEGIRSCCWKEPWDYDPERTPPLSKERVPTTVGPEGFTIEELAPDPYAPENLTRLRKWAFQDPGGSYAYGVQWPFPDGAFTIENTGDGAIKFYKPQFEVPYIHVPGSEDQEEPTNPYAAAGSYPYITGGGVEPPEEPLKERVRKCRITVKEVTTDCRDFATAGYGTRMYVTFQCVDSETKLKEYWFSVYFFSESTLSNQAYVGWNYARALEGKFCFAGQYPYEDCEHTYQEQFEPGGPWWIWGVSALQMLTDPRAYFAYLPYGVGTEQWLDFPFPVDVRRIEIFNYVANKGIRSGFGFIGNSPEYTAIIDKIEIC